MIKFVTTLLTLILIVSSAYAGSSQPIPTINIVEESNTIIGARVQYLADSSRQLSLENILKPGIDWRQSTMETPSFGYTNDHYWFRFRLDYKATTPHKVFVAIEYPLLDHVEFYQLENNTLVNKLVTGDTYPFSQRAVDNRNFLFPVTLSPNKPIDIYIKTKTQGSTQLPISIVNVEQYLLEDSNEVLLKSLYYGMILILLLYNLFIYISIKETPYLYYVGIMLSILVLTFGLHGFSFQHLYPDSPRFHEIAILFSVPSGLLFACLFTNHFLKLEQVAPTLNKVLLSFAAAFIICMIGAFFLPYFISTRASVFLAIPCSLLIMFSGPYAWRLGQTSAGYFTFSWIFLLTGIFVTASAKFGLLPRNTFTEYAINWGSAIEALLLSFALADKFNQERSARFAAQKEKLQEIEIRKEAETKLYHQATHQNINGFPNMIILQQVMNNLLHCEEQSRRGFTLVLISLSRLHEINKTLGHANADLVLSLFSQRLKKLSIEDSSAIVIEENERDTYYFSHVGGVLFAQVLENYIPENALTEADDIRQKLSAPIEFSGMRLDLGLSFGVASYPFHGSDIATLIRHARVAVDVAQKSNPPLKMYSDDINPYSARRLTLMGELKQAIADNSLELYFQPIVDSHTRKAISAESLIRWNHPDMGFIPPDEFITLAEKTGIIDSLTDWVLEQAFKALKQWHEDNDTFTIAINISAVNLHNREFADKILALLEQYSLKAESIILEVTETAVMKNPEIALDILNKLTDLGFKIGIDDFGTGHSSLSYIRKLPVYEVKVDRSFISNMTKNNDDAIITKTALNLSHDLGYKVVAEGVEDEETFNTLKQMDCDFIQGYHLSRPLPLNEFNQWIVENRQS